MVMTFSPILRAFWELSESTIRSLEVVVKTTIKGLQEIAIGVADLELSLRLYREGLGLEVLGRGSIASQDAQAVWGYGGAVEVAILERAREAGGQVVRSPVSIDSPLLGTGRLATLESPLGVLIELHEST
jgi:catechol 2,3-dioxygenase-like lactoylglutathione lyase family enzyme